MTALMPDAGDDLAARHMTRFQCLGAECPDTCCKGWDVFVTRDGYDRLKRVLSSRAGGEARFRQLVERLPKPKRGKSRFGKIRMSSGGDCAALDDGQCRIHRDHGENVLANVCSVFPRRVQRYYDRVEYSSYLSCPETARQVLTEADSMELDSFDRASLPRQVAETLPTGTAPYHQRFDDVRMRMLALLDAGPAPLRTRLFFQSVFALQAASWFTPDGGGGGPGLDASWGEFARPDVLEPLMEQLDQLADQSDQIVVLIERMLTRRNQTPMQARFRSLLDSVIAGCPRDANGQFGPRQLAEATLRRREYWQAAAGEALDEMLTRYARHFWLSEPYLKSGDLLEHQLRLLAHVALIRFLVFNHDRMASVADSQDELEPALAKSRMQETLVEVVYQVARNVSQDRVFTAALPEMFSAYNMRELAMLAHLCRF